MPGLIECRNCHLVWQLDASHYVKPGYRFCAKCFGKMCSIGQIVDDYRTKDGTWMMLWEGDPFNVQGKSKDPTRRMFPQQGKPLGPPKKPEGK